MIYRVYSSDERFKELRFHDGFNVLVAEKSQESRKDQTRNAVGKSSFIEIIHFLLGSEVRSGDLLSNEALKGITFGMEFDLSGAKVCVERNTEKPNSVRVSGDGLSKMYSGDTILKMNDIALDVKEWNLFLGRFCFSIDKTEKYAPTFRMLFPYFCRREIAGGIQDPFTTSTKQQDWQRYIAISYLLGLNWNILAKMEALRIKSNELKKLKKELKDSGVVGEVLGKMTQLRSELAIAERRLFERESELSEYVVLPGYREIESEASLIARKIADLSDRNTADNYLIAELDGSLQNEQPPDKSSIERLYMSAGIQLPSVTLKRLESVYEFHLTVVRNRKAHLQNEIISAKQRIAKRSSEGELLASRQKELMGILKTHGALDQFNRLQTELARMRANRDSLKQRLDIAQKIETGGATLKVERATYHQQLVSDFNERAERLNNAIVMFADLTQRVSERSSVLNIEPVEKGLDLKITNAPSKSKGIREQQTFCLDILFSVCLCKEQQNLGFLVHDSHLFDAMEERQVANAFLIGKELCSRHGFQYIITMNSDRIPYSDLPEGFNFDQYIIDTHLSDKTIDGGLFGFRFD